MVKGEKHESVKQQQKKTNFKTNNREWAAKWTRPWTSVARTKWTIASINQLVSHIQCDIQMNKEEKSMDFVMWRVYKIERDREKSIELTLWLRCLQRVKCFFHGCFLSFFLSLASSSSVMKLCAGLITSIGQMFVLFSFGTSEPCAHKACHGLEQRECQYAYERQITTTPTKCH